VSNKLHKNIGVTSVTITTVTAKCERCKATASGQCNYPNHGMFVQRELKYTTIQVARTSTGFPKEVLVCPACLKDLETLWLEVPARTRGVLVFE
jgi:hypothetical protein